MFGSAQIKQLLRKLVAAVIGLMLALVLLTALLVTGFYLLVQASILGLSPHVGEAGAMSVVGAACVVLLLVVFWRLLSPAGSTSRQKRKPGAESPVAELRTLIQENPLEAVLAAFAMGVAQQGDPRLRALLLKGGMELMQRPDGPPPTSHQDASQG